jgi:hypothetical protein
VIRPPEHRLWDRQAERPGGLEIDNEIELRGCSTGKSPDLAPLKILSM